MNAARLLSAIASLHSSQDRLAAALRATEGSIAERQSEYRAAYVALDLARDEYIAAEKEATDAACRMYWGNP